MCLCASVRAWEWIRSVLGEGAESRNVGRIAERTAKRSVAAATTMEKCSARHGSETNETMGGGVTVVVVAEQGEREKWRTTCRNNVGVFDLGHVTEPH